MIRIDEFPALANINGVLSDEDCARLLLFEFGFPFLRTHVFSEYTSPTSFGENSSMTTLEENSNHVVFTEY